jgi:hypothetical protein
MNRVNTRERIKEAALPLFAEQFEELARERITETPDEFDFDGLRAFGDTRAELISLARQFETAAERQKPYLRLIEESRLTESGRSFEQRANEAMFEALVNWVATKPAGAALDAERLAALTMNVFGSWLFFLGKRQQGVELAAIDRDALLEDWARTWSEVLDSRN